ncbi:hypothetical protein BC332_03310 [Capsicum chinense]|nr:hypothetical protein BC332_03310 [Capsicum chinense]
MKWYVDQRRSERELQVGDWVYLKLQPYRQTSIALRKHLKLCPKFYGPYKVLQRVGKVAYKLELPTNSRIHPVFHVSLLKKRIGPDVTPLQQLSLVGTDGKILVRPLAILQRRMVKGNNVVAVKVLIQWENLAPEEATWEDWTFIKAQFPDFIQGFQKLVQDTIEGNAWHADHIIPVYKGGGECRLENMRTLCVACHADVAATQHSERRLTRLVAKKKLKAVMSNLKTINKPKQNVDEPEISGTAIPEQEKDTVGYFGMKILLKYASLKMPDRNVKVTVQVATFCIPGQASHSLTDDGNPDVIRRKSQHKYNMVGLQRVTISGGARIFIEGVQK